MTIKPIPLAQGSDKNAVEQLRQDINARLRAIEQRLKKLEEGSK